MNPTAVKLAIAGAVLIWAVVATWAWQHEVTSFVTYKAEVAAVAKAAEKEAKETEARHQQTMKEFSNAWETQLPEIRNKAVAAYLARYPSRLCKPCGGQVSEPTASPQGTHGTGEERVVAAACEPDSQFIQDCADDAGKVRLCRQWIEKVGFPLGD